MNRVTACVLLVVCLGVTAAAQTPPAWRDPSPHQVRMINVETGVDLEVLDWGGEGRPIVLLAGLGNTAHVFDEFAAKLTKTGHVYGITRRGYGASSRPESGYDAERLGQDVLAVLNHLSLTQPVLVGHSIAGQELSFLASTQADRIGGLVYLDAAYRYALFRPGALEHLAALRERLNLLEAEMKKGPRPAAELTTTIHSVIGDSLTEFQRDLQELTTTPPPPPGGAPRPMPPDLADFDAYRKWSQRVQGYALPEAELRQLSAVTPTGGVGERPTPASVGQAISAGSRRFTQIAIPTLAIFASPHDLGPWTRSDAATRSGFEGFAKFDQAMVERQARWFEARVAGSRVIRIPNGSHYLFVTHADDVLKDVNASLRSLQ